MDPAGERPVVTAVDPRNPAVAALVNELTAELAASGYTDEQTFGYSVERLAASGVHLVGARVDGELAGIGGLEVAGTDGELKRFYVRPVHRGRGVADAVLDTLVAQARERGVVRLRLETGDLQHAAIAFYRRHGFAPIPRFGPYVDSATSYCMQRDL